MEISLLKAFLDNLSQFNQPSSCNNIKFEPIQKYYEKIDEILKLLRPMLEAVFESQLAPNEQLNKELKELDGLFSQARKLIEGWHPITSKFYFVMQIESFITRIQASCLDVFRLLASWHQSLSADLNSFVELCTQKLQYIKNDQTSSIIKEAIRDQIENSIPSLESMVKIADSLSLTSNLEVLMEVVALETVKLHAEQDEKDGEIKYIDHIIDLVTHMHDLLVKIKESQITTVDPIPDDFCCPLSLELMSDPVIVASGQTYERAFIRKWLDLGLSICPKTHQILVHTNLIPNFTVKALIANWCELNNVKIPDPLKSMNFNHTSALLTHYSGHSPTITNFPRSPESTTSKCSPYKRLSSSGNHEEKMSLSYALSVSVAAEGISDARGADEQFQGHNQSASVSNIDYLKGTLGDVNEISQVSSGLTHYSSDASGEVTTEPPVLASDTPHREPEFLSRLVEARSRSRTIWRHPTERFVPRIVSSSAIDMQADLFGIESRVRKLVEDLQSTSIDLQRTSTSELRLLAKHNMDNRVVIANCGAVSLLVGLLHSTDTKIQENAVTSLLNLSINDNNKSAIANADAIEPLIRILETGSAAAKENSAATLFSLSVIEENKVRIGRSGAIGPLVELLGNGTPRGRKDATTALFNLSTFQENKIRIVQAGAVKYLIELMDPSIGMVDKAVAVLANLATIDEGQSAIGQGGGIPILVEVVELGSARGKENAAAVLLKLCTNNNRFCSMVLLEGVVPPLVVLSQSGTPRAKEKALALLSYFRNQRHGNTRRR